MLRFLLSWGASSPSHATASLDVTAAFLNAALPEGLVVVLRPSTILYKLQLLPPGHIGLVDKAIYGLRDAPNNLWSEQRTEVLTQTTLTVRGSNYTASIFQRFVSLFARL